MLKVEFKVVINPNSDSQKELDEFDFIELYDELSDDEEQIENLKFTAYCGDQIIQNISVNDLYELAHRADKLEYKHEAYLQILGRSFNGCDLLEQVDDDYVGEFDTAYSFIEDHLGVEIPECLENHIDYDRVFEAEFSDSYFRVNGHYFRNS